MWKHCTVLYCSILYCNALALQLLVEGRVNLDSAIITLDIHLSHPLQYIRTTQYWTYCSIVNRFTTLVSTAVTVKYITQYIRNITLHKIQIKWLHETDIIWNSIVNTLLFNMVSQYNVIQYIAIWSQIILYIKLI